MRGGSTEEGDETGGWTREERVGRDEHAYLYGADEVCASNGVVALNANGPGPPLTKLKQTASIAAVEGARVSRPDFEAIAPYDEMDGETTPAEK
ncbi:hypothetical protein PC9H_006845 [Pleurotus ostreatus]|uniref:Uncharacterized protein n=1 Tax=Pleurotus ostreatus TaxID=5322 RepID=A0A8H6ZXG0_PLEOS|nr:uncharacterized protein PC9H_006845 [Pleurotus ostreatus]KAF7431125.1 hypothetical protein PC9H_006845 [Pleurotus ostreatus]